MDSLLTTVKKEAPDEESENSSRDNGANDASANEIDEEISPPVDIQIQFPWLVFDVDTKAPICKLCKQAGYICEIAGLRHEALVGHAWTFSHKDAESKLTQSYKCELDEEDHDRKLKHIEDDVSYTEDDEKLTNTYNHSRTPRKATTRQERSEIDKHRRRFCRHWLGAFPWLYYNEQQNLMFCAYCLKHRDNGNSTFVKGTCSFKITTIHSHAQCRDHQLAERAEALERSMHGKTVGASGYENMTQKQRYLLGQFLKFFPWLLYNPEVNVLICDVCQRHGTNNLYLDCSSEIDYSMLRSHADNRRHIQCEEMEIHSWSVAFDVSQAQGCPPEPNEALLSLIRQHRGLDIPASNTTQTHPGAESRDTERHRTDQAVSEGLEMSVSESPPRLDGDHLLREEYLTPRSLKLSSITLSNDGEEDPDYLPSKTGYRSKKGNILPAFGHFKQEWVEEFPWIAYDSKRNLMFCIVCAKYAKNTTFARGVRVFSRSYIIHHTKIAKHRDAAGKEGIIIEYDQEPAAKRRKHKPSNDVASEEDHDNPLSASVDESTAVMSYSSQEHSYNTDSTLDNTTEYDSPSGEEEMSPQKTSNDSSPKSPENQMCPSVGEEQAYSEGGSARKRRRFCDRWYKVFPWLHYDYENNTMLCIVCKRHGLENTFTRGNRSFHVHTLKTHEGTIGHQKCLSLGLTTNETEKSDTVQHLFENSP